MINAVLRYYGILYLGTIAVRSDGCFHDSRDASLQLECVTGRQADGQTDKEKNARRERPQNDNSEWSAVRRRRAATTEDSEQLGATLMVGGR